MSHAPTTWRIQSSASDITTYVGRLSVGLGMLFMAAVPLTAQTVFGPTVDLELDAPEAWAMAYFASASVLTSLGPVEPVEPGSVAVAFEGLYVPELDREQRTVGFGGFKEEDLNRSAAWGRLRLELGLPADFTLTLGWIPPVELDGVEANMVSAAIGRPLVTRDRWGVGLRVFIQEGQVDGDLTCKEGGDHLFPAGSADNPFGCDGPSSDEVTLDLTGAQLVAHHRIGQQAAIYAGFSYQDMDLSFQVDAPTFGLLDRTLLLADGETYALTMGSTWTASNGLGIGVEAFYSDLDVTRPGRERESDPFWNLRASVTYRIR